MWTKITQAVLEFMRDRAEKAADSYDNMVNLANSCQTAMESHHDPYRNEYSRQADNLRGARDSLQLTVHEIEMMINKGKASDTDSVIVGSFVKLSIEGNEEEISFYVVPNNGSGEIEIEDLTITIISPETPIISAILGKTPGEKGFMDIRDSKKEISVIEVVNNDSTSKK